MYTYATELVRRFLFVWNKFQKHMAANMKTHGKHGREPDNDDLLDLAPSEISRILVAIFSVYILCNIIFYNNNYKPL